MEKIPLSVEIQRRGIQAVSHIWPGAAAEFAMRRFLSTTRYPRPAEEIAVLQNARSRQFKNGVQGWTWGQGPRVLLVHGWDGRGSQLSSFVEPLTTAGFEVTAIDGPAHGDTAGEMTNIAEFARALIFIQQECGEFHAVIAHSFGAGASLIASSWGLKTQGLVLIACPSDILDVFQKFANFFKLSKRARTLFQQKVEIKAGIKMSEVVLEDASKIQNLEVLVVHDRNDKEIDFAHAAKLAKAFSKGQILETEGLGHRRILKSSDVVRSCVKFVESFNS
jgi:pimeloyl-ACP methyl ester carboxylesterase